MSFFLFLGGTFLANKFEQPWCVGNKRSCWQVATNYLPLLMNELKNRLLLNFNYAGHNGVMPCFVFFFGVKHFGKEIIEV